MNSYSFLDRQGMLRLPSKSFSRRHEKSRANGLRNALVEVRGPRPPILK